MYMCAKIVVSEMLVTLAARRVMNEQAPDIKDYSGTQVIPSGWFMLPKNEKNRSPAKKKSNKTHPPAKECEASIPKRRLQSISPG